MWKFVAPCALLWVLSTAGAQEEVVFDASNIDASDIRICERPEADVGYQQLTLGGRPCVSTKGLAGSHWLVFDVPDAFCETVTGPLSLLLTYYDDPAGLVEIRYDARDDEPGIKAGAIGRAARFLRSGSGEWRTTIYRLPAPVMSNRTQGVGDVAIMGWTMVDNPLAADVAVGRLVITRRIVDLQLTPNTVAANGEGREVTVEAVCTTGGAPVADGTEVVFTDSVGSLNVSATTLAGRAEATFEPPPRRGWDFISAESVGVAAYGSVYVLDGTGPLEERVSHVMAFQELEEWTVSQDGAPWTVAYMTDSMTADGPDVLRVDYGYDPEKQGAAYFTLDMNQPLPEGADRLSLRMHGDASHHFLQILVRDAGGEEFRYDTGVVDFLGWGDIECDLRRPPDEVVGPQGGNQILDFPASLVGLRILRSDQHVFARRGGLVLQEIVATHLAAALR